jgi:hypothetical protein
MARDNEKQLRPVITYQREASVETPRGAGMAQP